MVTFKKKLDNEENFENIATTLSRKLPNNKIKLKLV